MHPKLSRRTLLKGVGTAITLPFLESLFPARVVGAEAAKAVVNGPRRLAWLYVPNGIHMPAWTPSEIGRDYTLSPTLQPLAPFKNKFNIISGLVDDKANAHGDGGGDHARAQASYLTGMQPYKTQGANIRVGISADQAAAEKIGHLTKFPSLEMGMEGGPAVGACDTGYSCLYSHNLSWRGAATPVAKDSNPQSIFDRLVGNGSTESAAARAQQLADKKSVLDYISVDAKSVNSKLNAADKQKMDEYLTSIREIELRLGQPEPEIELPKGTVRPGISTPTQNKTDYNSRIRIMIDLMVLAFQADLTRIITFPFADEASNQRYVWAGADVEHHTTSHHMGDAAKQALLQKINTFHVQQLAYLLGRLDDIKEGNGSILDNSLIGYGSGNSDGNRHNHDDLPFLLLGRGGNTVTGGRHLDANGTAITNVWLTMLERAGANVSNLGDSTGKYIIL